MRGGMKPKHATKGDTMNRRILISLAPTLALAALLSAGGLMRASADQENPVGPLTSLTVANGNERIVLSIETVRGREATARGLMFRKELGADRGMLFDFEREAPLTFWMRNTLIPLDMVFAKDDGEVIKVHADAKPLDETPVESGEPARYVLEIEGGAAARFGIKVGSRLEIGSPADPIIKTRGP